MDPLVVSPVGSLHERHGVMAANGLTQPSTTIPLLLCNPHPEDCTLKRGSVVARVEPHPEADISVFALPPCQDMPQPKPVPTTSTTGADKAAFLEQLDINTAVLTPDQLHQLQDLLWEFHDIFLYGSKSLKQTDKVQHHIKTGDHPPISSQPYRVGPTAGKQIEDHIKKMLDQNVIRPSTSPWSFPVVMAPKKDGTLRFCVDFRKLNKITVKDVYPLPRIDDTLDALAGLKFVSVLDAAMGYWQVPVAEEDRAKTAFTTKFGLFEFVSCPLASLVHLQLFKDLWIRFWQDLNGFPALFTWMTLSFLVALLKTIWTIFERSSPLSARMAFSSKPSKCRFARQEVEYLGHIVSEHGVSVDKKKVAAIQQFPKPNSLSKLRSFLGLCNYYRRFVPNFANIAEPLIDLTRLMQTRSMNGMLDTKAAFKHSKTHSATLLFCNSLIFRSHSSWKPTLVTLELVLSSLKLILTARNPLLLLHVRCQQWNDDTPLLRKKCSPLSGESSSFSLTCGANDSFYTVTTNRYKQPPTIDSMAPPDSSALTCF